MTWLSARCTRGPEMTKTVLAVEGITKRFGVNEVLRKVTLALERAEIRAICGENGAGKSTLVKIITGVHPTDGGVVLVDGKPTAIVDPQHAQALGIALVAQELSLPPALSVLDNIWLGIAPWRSSTAGGGLAGGLPPAAVCVSSTSPRQRCPISRSSASSMRCGRSRRKVKPLSTSLTG